MNKPLTMIIKETKNNLVNTCNESGLSPIMLDLIIQGIYFEIHSVAERQAMEEENVYAKAIEEASKKAKILDKNADSEK